MNENDVLFQKVTQAYSEKNPSAPILSIAVCLCHLVIGRSYVRLLIGALGIFPSMPVSLSGIIHHSKIF